LISHKNNYLSIMKTTTKNPKTYEITYNPELDHLIGKVFFKEKMERARAFLKEHGLPKDIVEELNRKADLEKHNS
jgi:hypothetical protein